MFLHRVPFLELTSLIGIPLLDRSEEIPKEIAGSVTDGTDPRLLVNSVQWVEDMKSPRTIKAHMPLDMLPPDLLKKGKGSKFGIFVHIFVNFMFVKSRVRLPRPEGRGRVLLPPLQDAQVHVQLRGGL